MFLKIDLEAVFLSGSKHFVISKDMALVALVLRCFRVSHNEDVTPRVLVDACRYADGLRAAMLVYLLPVICHLFGFGGRDGEAALWCALRSLLSISG